ncbi:MAG: hypothetical protein EF813_07195 [Methanosarcinales archaeon]|nr:MAG: hypothetical protein EF813_07195 [Methanosarcinales archaeon]
MIRICKNRCKGLTIRLDFPTIQRTDQTALSHETAAPDGGRLAPKTPKYSRIPPSRCTGVSGRHERFWQRHPKAHPDFGIARSKDPGLERLCLIGRASVLGSDHIICSRLTELMAKNSGL